MRTIAVVLAWTFAIAGIARAEGRCPAIEGGAPALEAVDAETRLAFVRETMRDQASRARTWHWAWGGIGVGLAAAGYAQIPLVDKDKVLPQVITSTAPFYLPLSMLLFPLRVNADDRALEDFLAKTSTPVGPMAPCLRLARAEELLQTAADDEASHVSLLQHLVSLVLSGAYTTFLAVAFHDLRYTLVDGAGSFVVGEIQILTTPTGAVRALESYRRGEVPVIPPPKPVAWTLAPMGSAPGVSIVGAF